MSRSIMLAMVVAVLLLAGCSGDAASGGSSQTAVAAGVPNEDVAMPNQTPDANVDQPQADADHRATAVLAGGCFWCVEAVFEELEGVHDAISGYAGGTAETANYDAVSTGQTGHAEAVQIVYDPTKISYEKLLEVHFATHDPTTLNRQGYDTGPQYRSTIFYANDEEKAIARAYIEKLQASGVYAQPIVTTLEPLTEFYEAERYHQNYVCDNPTAGYVRNVALPKVDKVRKLFKDDLKKDK